MTEKIETHGMQTASSPVIPVWFDAYIAANKKFPLIPTAIDARVGLAILRSIGGGVSTWKKVVESGFSDTQRKKAEDVMTKMHLAFHIPLVGGSQSHRVNDKTTAMHDHFVSHYKRPLQTDAYEVDKTGTHMVVKPDAIGNTWKGIVAETVRAALVFGQVQKFPEPSIQQFNVHKTERSSVLQESIIEALDRSFKDSAHAGALDALIRLYTAANTWGSSRAGGLLAKHHRSHFDLSKEHGKTPFEVTDHLRVFNGHLAQSLQAEIDALTHEGRLSPDVDMKPFIDEMVKEGRFT